MASIEVVLCYKHYQYICFFSSQFHMQVHLILPATETFVPPVLCRQVGAHAACPLSMAEVKQLCLKDSV